MHLIETFNWKSELVNESEFFGPSLEFIKQDDHSKLTISGAGKNKLEGFLITYIVPKSYWFSKLFNVYNYNKGEIYSLDVQVSKGYLILQQFLNGKHDDIKKSLPRVIVSINKQLKKEVEKEGKKEISIESNLTLPKVENERKVPKKKNVKSRYKKNSFDLFFEKQVNYYKSRPIFERMILRLMGPLVSAIFFLPVWAVVDLKGGLLPFIITGMIFFMYFIGTIKFELSLVIYNRKQKRLKP